MKTKGLGLFFFYLSLILGAVILVLPFYFIVGASLKPPN